MTRQTSIQVTKATETEIAYLKGHGYGTTTNIVREAIKRMAEQEGMTRPDYHIYTETT